MPNHVTSVCFVTGPDASVAAFVATHIVPREDGDGSFFDFGTVIPRPKCIEETESGSEADDGFFALTGLHDVKFAAFAESPMHIAARHHGFPMGPMTTREEYAAWLAEKNPRAIAKGEAAVRAFRETGHRDWYSWNCANWGTKWNSYDYEERFTEPGKFAFKFETAWNVPEPVFVALAARYPDLTFKLSAVDEGGPEFEGLWSGSTAKLEKVPHSAERYRLAYGRDPETEDEDEEESEALS